MVVKPESGPMADTDVGEFVEAVDTLTKRHGRVTIDRHERGWVIRGRDPRRDNDPLAEFRAEINDCDRCPAREKVGTRNFGPRPVCKTIHGYDTDLNTNHFTKHYCHELGHAERVKALADKVLKSY